jgi:hypothetical protein
LPQARQPKMMAETKWSDMNRFVKEFMKSR